MSTFHRKIQLSLETPEGLAEEVEPDEIDSVQAQCDVEVSSAETSSISGSESASQFKIPLIQIGEAVSESIVPSSVDKPFPVRSTSAYQTETAGKVKPTSEFNLLAIGICLTVLLAIFSCLLLVKINSYEQSHVDVKAPFTIEDAESILNKNVLIVRNVREKLEDLQSIMLKTFEKMPLKSDKDEF